MKCLICRHGETSPSKGTVTLERGKTTIVFKSVPANVCENCGERYYDEATTAALLKIAEEAVNQGVTVDVREYMAA